MHNSPRITIVTPSFNQGRFLARTIQSVLAQEYENLEYIIVDGGSTDESSEILRRHANRLTYWISEPDHGQADAIMKGFRMSTGDIMAWLNSDDLLMPNSLATVATYFAQSNDTQMVYGDSIVIDEHDQLLGIVEQIPARFETLFYGGHIINQEAVFWRRELYEKVGGLNNALQYALDYDLWVRMARHTKPYHVPTILSAFRLHQPQKSGRMECYNLEKHAIQRELRQRLGEGKLAFALKSLLWRTFMSLNRQASRIKHRSAALIQRNHLVKISDPVVRLVQFYGTAWLYGYHSDGWLRRSAAFAIRGEHHSRKLRMKYFTHGLPVEGMLKVKVWEVTEDHWNPLSQLEFQICREGDAVEIEVPASTSPIVVIHFDFGKCCVLAARSLKSLLGRDFRSVSIHITDLDFSTGHVPNLLLK